MNTVLWALLTALCSPFLLTAAWLRKRPAKRKILIIQWAKLGDMVCTTPMFRAIKTSHPDWEVHLLCREQSAAVVKNNPFIDRVIVGGARGKMITMLSRERYDAVVNCLPGAFFSMLGLWCGARDRINAFSRLHGRLVLAARILNTVNREYIIGTRTFDHYLSLLAPLGIPAIPYQLDFFPSAEDEAEAKRWTEEHGLKERSFVCFGVTAGNAVKEWPAEKFAELADLLIARCGLCVALSTLDRRRVEQIRKLSTHPEKLLDASSLTLGSLGAVCKLAAAFVSVDTGPMFMAHAVGTPIVVLIGGSDPREQIPPAGERVVHVAPPGGCEPWMHVTLSPRSATEAQLSCVRETGAESVAAAVETLIGRK
ncbi:glycosyltransferase family 9 protein [Candidatus Peregrinibacteria bacterium]|nr:glycosyltransferase family 9 protein [Candidatus Peregrinibacteria bacterium]